MSTLRCRYPVAAASFAVAATVAMFAPSPPGTRTPAPALFRTESAAALDAHVWNPVLEWLRNPDPATLPTPNLAAWLMGRGPDELLVWANTVPLSETERRRLFEGVVRLHGESDPEAAFHLAQALRSGLAAGQHRRDLLSLAADPLARNAPTRLWTLLQSEPPSRFREQLLALAAAEQWRAHSDETLAAWLATAAGSFYADSFAEPFANAIAQTDAARTARWADSLPPGTLRRAVTQAAWSRLLETDPAAWPRSISPGLVLELGPATVVSLLAQRDLPAPTAATLDAIALSQGPDAASLAALVVEAWTRRHPADAAAWLDRQAVDALPANTIAQLAPELFAIRPTLISKWMNEATDPDLKALLAARTLAASAANEPEQALARAEALPDPAERIRALRHMIATLAAHDPELAVQTMTRHPDAASDVAVQRAAVTLGAENIASALAWADQLPSPLASAARASLVDAWLTADPPEAARWIEALPAGPERDRMRLAQSGALAPQTPQAAVEMVKTLPPTPARFDALRQAFGIWHDHDAQAARQWLASAQALTPEERGDLSAATDARRESSFSQAAPAP